jgi:hypothetical protein
MRRGRSPLRAWLLACMAGLGLSAPAAASPARGESASPTPAEWVRYAGLLGEALRTWLASETPEAGRLRARLEGEPPPTAPRSVPVKVWVGADGVVTRAETQTVGGAAANADLSAVVVGRRLGEPPPAGLPSPIRLRLTFTPPVGGGDRAGDGAAASPPSS